MIINYIINESKNTQCRNVTMNNTNPESHFSTSSIINRVTSSRFLHNTKGPAIEREDGTKEFFYKGLRNRLEDKPAFESELCSSWWVLGMRNRRNGPAVIIRNRRGVIIREEFWLKNRLHNPLGPAVIIRNGSGKMIDCQYWIGGVPLNRDDELIELAIKELE